MRQYLSATSGWDYQRERLSRLGPDPDSVFGRASETRMLRPSSGFSLS